MNRNFTFASRFTYGPARPVAFACFILAIMASCTDFFEQSVADEVPVLLSPGADAETNHYSMLFLWEPLDHALQYHFQVASPSFDSVRLYHADTILSASRFDLTLEPGKFQWRVRAINGSSATEYARRSLTVHEANLSHQTVLPLQPGDGNTSTSAAHDFKWQAIYSARYYRLQADTVPLSDIGTPLLEQVVAGTSASITLPGEGRYFWRIRAENDTEQSRWSATRAFVYDSTPPAVPQVISPLGHANVGRPVTLKWAGSTDAVGYRLYVYRRDTMLLNETYPIYVGSPSYKLSEGPRGEALLWRVRAVDRAGNHSGFSSLGSFVIRN